MTARKLESPLNLSGIEPCGNRILVKPDEVQEKTEGGIVLPNQVTERHADAAGYGYVIAVGPDCYTHTVTTTKRSINGVMRHAEESVTGYSGAWAKNGDRVAFRPYVGLNSTGEDGKKYLLLNDEDILAIVTNNVTQTTIEARKPLSIK